MNNKKPPEPEAVRIPKTPREYELEVFRLEELLGVSTSDAQGIIDAAIMEKALDKKMNSAHCQCCGRLIAHRFKLNNRKARVRHKCPHGTWCIAGHKTDGMHAHNPKCPACYRESALYSGFFSKISSHGRSK